MCQDTPCNISDLSDHLCKCSILLYAIKSFHWTLFPKRIFFGPWGQTAPSWGWRLSTFDGPMYGITGNNSEKRSKKHSEGLTWLLAYIYSISWTWGDHWNNSDNGSVVILNHDFETHWSLPWKTVSRFYLIDVIGPILNANDLYLPHLISYILTLFLKFRCFIGINPERGRKTSQGKVVSKKTGKLVHREAKKVLNGATFLKNLMDFEWVLNLPVKFSPPVSNVPFQVYF